MKNIFNQNDYLELTNRISALSETNTANWGIMNLDQMLLHCTEQLKLALGENSSKPQGPRFMKSSLAKWFIFSTIPWPKGANTPREMNIEILDFTLSDLETEKRNLVLYLENIKKQTSLKPHPFFGVLSQKEWARLIYKHIDHHLRQFE